MQTVQTIAEAQLIPAVARVMQPDGSWVVFEPGEKLPDGLFGAPLDPVPREITMRQARLVLHAAGKLAAVEAAVSAMPEPPREAARITWDYSQTVERRNPFVVMLAAQLGMSDADLDALFVAAAEL